MTHIKYANREDASPSMGYHKKTIATLCYIQKDDQTLMLHRVKKENDIHAGKYNGLGGKIELAENPRSCIIREVEEEAGVSIDPIYVANLTFCNLIPGEDWEVHLFRANGYEGTLTDCVEGDLEWVPNNKVLDLPMWPADSIFLKHLHSKTFFWGTFWYDNGDLKDYTLEFEK